MKLPLTYRSALKLLGSDEPAMVRVLDTLLGGVILASGVVAFPTGSAVLTSVWGWVDQKNEFVKLLDKGVSYARVRLGGVSGYERSQLITAAHSVIVGEAMFHGLQVHLGPAYRALKLTDREKQSLFTDADASKEYGAAIAALLDTPVDVPWAGCAFDENLATNIKPYLRAGIARCLASFEKLAVWKRAWNELGRQPSIDLILNESITLYEKNYFRLAADVPEFLVWAMLGGLRSIGLATGVAGRDIAGALGSQTTALNRVEAVLSLVSHSTGPQRHRVALEKANRAILEQPLIKIGEMDRTAEMSIPSIEVGYVVPRFRFAVIGADSQPSSEQWWQSRSVRSDLDEFLIAYLTSARSTQQPLVVLGHPGAGKSLLTRVLTARLSATSFPAFLVPLRRVREPSAPIYQQVQQMLDESTHARAVWSSIADATGPDPNGSGGATRVVLLDGLDELMQATGTTESSYLSQVQEFQRVEATQDAPVAVIVTSRQVVADLANIPLGCTVLRLEDFTDEQVEEWVDVWNRTNSTGVAGTAGDLSLESMRNVGAIARQPLLLLMIAIQAATSGGHAVAASEAAVYRQLLVDFTRRELRKSARAEFVSEAPAEGMVNDELWRLGIAAFGMFNRGRQFVTEEQLQDDLVSLDPRGRPGRDDRTPFVRPLSDARRMIGRFFFIHTSETGEPEHRRKTYEFLHATFAEYLIAHHAVDRTRELIDSYQSYLHGRLRPAIAWDDDEVLYSLLSHRPIAVGAVVQFTEQIFDVLDPDERTMGGKVLEKLLANADRHRNAGRETAYNPGARSTVQRLASYVANLVLLRLLLLPDRSIALTDLVPGRQDPLTWWRSVVRLMQSGLDEATWLGVLQTIEPSTSGGSRCLMLRSDGLQDAAREVHEARLLFEDGAADIAHVGVALWRGVRIPGPASPVRVYSEVVSRRLFAAPAPGSALPLLAEIRLLGELESPVSLAVVEYLLTHCAYLPANETIDLAAAAVTSATAAVRAVPLVVARPQLLRLLPQLDAWYGRRLSAADFARVGGAFALLNLIGSEEEKNLGWPLYKVLMRTNAHQAAMVSPRLLRKYASVAAVADEARAALLPAIVDALAQDLIGHAEAGTRGREASSGSAEPQSDAGPR